MTRLDNSRVIRPATGPDITAKSWLTEAPMRMLMNNLHPDVAEGHLQQPSNHRRRNGIQQTRLFFSTSASICWQ